MEAVWVALIAATGIGIAALISVVGPIILYRMQNQRLSAIQNEVAAVKTQTDGVLTAAYRSEIAAVEAQVVAMRRPSPDTVKSIRETEARLAVMRRNLADRENAALAAHQQIFDGAEEHVESP